MDISRITAKQLTEDRLDASYYGTRYLENDAFLRSCGVPMAPVGYLKKGKTEVPDPEGNDLVAISTEYVNAARVAS